MMNNFKKGVDKFNKMHYNVFKFKKGGFKNGRKTNFKRICRIT